MPPSGHALADHALGVLNRNAALAALDGHDARDDGESEGREEDDLEYRKLVGLNELYNLTDTRRNRDDDARECHGGLDSARGDGAIPSKRRGRA